MTLITWTKDLEDLAVHLRAEKIHINYLNDRDIILAFQYAYVVSSIYAYSKRKGATSFLLEILSPTYTPLMLYPGLDQKSDYVSEYVKLEYKEANSYHVELGVRSSWLNSLSRWSRLATLFGVLPNKYLALYSTVHHSENAPRAEEYYLVLFRLLPLLLL